jgi:hypothetical protein
VNLQNARCNDKNNDETVCSMEVLTATKTEAKFQASTTVQLWPSLFQNVMQHRLVNAYEILLPMG